MKIKFLLPALAGLAMVSCSQEEDFVSVNAEKGDFSSITFSVSKEQGADTRAWLGDDNGRWNNFTFGEGDLLSLFNGMTATTNAWTSIGQNAVFEGEGGSEELVFKTRSIVNQGTAIMVYPADTIFANSGSDLEIKIAADQNENTKNFIPYVSDVMNIVARDVNQGIDKNNTAGYGRKYDVILRPAASLFGMTLAPTQSIDFAALGVADIKFTKVEIGNNSVDLFPTEATVTPSTEDSNLPTADSKFAHFTSQADVTVSAQSASISTTDIKDNIAYFSLLPMEAETADDAVNITVSTTYGSVKVANDAAAGMDAEGPLQNNAKDAGKNLKENLASVFTRTWAATPGSKFGEEKQGRVIRRTLSLDLSTLDMRGTVVTTSEQLINLLKVYKALGIDTNVSYTVVNLILNGANNEFNLSGAALDALKLYNANGKVKLDVVTNNQKIVLVDAGATLAKLKESSVNFVNGSNVDEAVDVVLGAGVDWELDQEYTNTKVQKIISRGNLTYTNADAGTNAPAYELEVEGTMSFGSNSVRLGAFTAQATSQITVATGKTVTFDKAATLLGTIDNNGILSANATVTNKGYIDNKYEVSVLKGSAGVLTNIGNIYNDGSLAVTFITNNAADDDSNIGRIKLTTRNDNVSVKTVGKQGYITYTLNTKDANDAYTYAAESGDVFNWLTIETKGVAAKVNLSANVTYLEIKGNAADVTTNGAVTVTDLFVNPSMRLLGSNAITATNIYVNDYILHSGNLVGTLQKKYDSKVSGETEDAETYKNGQIRSVSSN